MSFDTLERKSPPLFRRTASPLARLGFVAALALFLMVADNRFQVGRHFRSAVATVLQPLQWLTAQPVKAIDLMGSYVTTVETANQTKEQATILIAQQALKAQRAELLMRENASLRDLLSLQQQLPVQARAAQVVHVAADPFTRRVVINKGSMQGIATGSAVIDEHGLVGQVVRVFPLSSEVTLLDNPEQATPVLNNRTGERSLVYGDSQTPRGGALEIRFLASTANMQVGDMISTSGVGGVYPPGLPVGTVSVVEKRNNSAFLRVQLQPVARLLSVSYVLVLDPPEPVKTEASANVVPPKPTPATRAAARRAVGRTATPASTAPASGAAP